MELTVQVPEGQLGRFCTALGECWLRAEHEARDGDGGRPGSFATGITVRFRAIVTGRPAALSSEESG